MAIHVIEKLIEAVFSVDGSRGSLAFSTPESNVAYVRSTVDGTIIKVAVYQAKPVTGGQSAWNLRQNGTALFSGASRPIITVGNSSDTKTGLSFSTVVGDLFQLDIDEIPSGGAPTPITLLIFIDDGVDVPANLDDLSDVTATSPTDGDLLQWDSGLSKWINAAIPAIPIYLDDLSDVSATSPSDGDVLTWDAGTSSWINAAPSGGGGGSGLYSPDLPYSSPSAYDDEFNAGSLDGKWSTLGTIPTITFNIPNHATFSSSLSSMQAIIQTVPSADYKFRMKISSPNTSGGGNQTGFVLRDATGYITYGYNVGNRTLYHDSWLSTAGVWMSANFGAIVPTSILLGLTLYLEVEYIQSTHTYYYRCSFDGINFYTIGNQSTLSGSATGIGIFCSNTAGGVKAYIDWFRQVQGSYTGGNA